MSDFFFSEDITYCMDGECLRTECVRHRSRAPIGVPLSWANMKYQEGCLLEKIKALPSAKDIDVSNKVRKEKMMSDLISRDAAIKLILSGRVGDDSRFECPAECNSMLEWAADEVAKMPAADVPDRKVGKWILYDIQDKDEVANGNFYYVCSCCGKGDTHAKGAKVPYCWWCGAMMEGK